MRTYTHTQGDIEKIHLYFPKVYDKENIIPVMVKFQERVIKYGSLDLLILQINFIKDQYLMVPGIVIGNKQSIGQPKVSYVSPIIKSQEQEQIKEMIRDHGLEGNIHFWEEE